MYLAFRGVLIREVCVCVCQGAAVCADGGECAATEPAGTADPGSARHGEGSDRSYLTAGPLSDDLAAL